MKFVITLLFSLHAMFAHSYTGNELFEDKTKHPEFYSGYVFATFLRVTNQGWLGECVNTVPYTLQQLKDITGKYLDDNPEIRHKAASWLIKNAFAEAFGTYEGERPDWCF